MATWCSIESRRNSRVVLDVILEPLEHGFMIRAFVVAIGIGVLCPMVGSYVVTRKLAFMGEALSHTVLPGLVLGYLIGLNPLVIAVPTCVLTALLIGYISRQTGLSEDTSIGILLAGLFALGLAMLSLSNRANVDLEGILLGEILGVSSQDVWIIFSIGLVTLGTLYLFHKELVFNSFDPQGAFVIGLPSRALDYLLLIIISLVVVASIQAVGVILMLAMLVTPSATAYLMARSFVSIMFIGSLIGIIAAVSGLYISYFIDLPSGPAMTLTAVGMFMVVAVLRRRLPLK